MRNFRSIYIALCIAGLLAPLGAGAQFYSSGDDPASAKWMESSSAHFRIIYPVGLDSLAKVYAAELERFREAEEWSSGYLPGEKYSRKMPVVLHPWNAVSNGSVTWAPMRMDLYTVPDHTGSDPLPWTTTLAVHESRHVSQMQLGNDGLFRPLNWLFGEVIPGGVAAVYPSTYFLEGDAVTAETALTGAGRGRRGDFLSYYMAAFDRGDYRNWYRWRWGSYRNYAPDHYALGYMTIAGARWMYDDSLFTADYFSKVRRNPLRVNNIQKAFKARSGKRFKAAYKDIMEAFHDVWSEAAEARAPFTEGERVTPAQSWHTEYINLAESDEGLLAMRSGKTGTARLVLIGDDGETSLKAFSESAGPVIAIGDKVYWGEIVPDIRYGLKQTSRIRYMSLKDRKIHDLTTGGRLYNPEPSEDGKTMVAIDYPFAGGSALVVLDPGTGKTLRRFDAPDSLQLTEAVFVPEGLAAVGISAAGSGLYLVHDDGTMSTLIAPVAATLTGLLNRDNGILFMSDRSGVTDIYRLSPQGKLFQETSTRYGVTDFEFMDDTLYFVKQEYEGHYIFKLPHDALLHREVLSLSPCSNPVAETIAAQERALAGEREWPSQARPVEMTAPKRFRKLLNIPHIHSWVPLSVHYDKIKDLSSEDVNEYASLGATVFFQNLLGTASGSLSYEYKIDQRLGKRHVGHLQFTYSGLFPVIEANMHFNERDMIQYRRDRSVFGGETREYIQGYYTGKPSFTGEISIYTPLNFTSGGWRKGLIPQLKYSFTNDFFNKTVTELEYREPVGLISRFEEIKEVIPGKNMMMHSLTASVRGYMMRNIAEAAVYPKWGIGIEGGYHTRVGMDDLFTSSVYGHVYGYLPGFFLNQGLKVSATYEHCNGAFILEHHLDLTPRGYSSSLLDSFIDSYAPGAFRLSLDYAMPFYIGDISAFSPLFYISHASLTPHFDWTGMSLGRGLSGNMNVCSAGADFKLHLANLLWIPYGTEVGVSYSRNFGPSVAGLNGLGADISDNYFGLIMNVDF